MGKRIAVYRKRRGWSQTELAKRLGCRQATVSEWENGLHEIGVLDIVKISRALRVSLAELVLGEP